MSPQPGESAGAFSVCAQVAAPAARGLFDRAISESFLPISRVLSMVWTVLAAVVLVRGTTSHRS